MLEGSKNPLNALLKRIPQGARRIRVLVPVALVAMLVVATAAVLGTFALQRANTGAVIAPSLVIARADYHSESILNGEDLELDLALSQTGNDCQAALNGGFCLRYAVVLEEKALMAGYGVIPASDVKVNASSISITVDTSKVPNFVYTVGVGGPIAVSWKTASTAGISPNALHNKPMKATTQGTIAIYPLPTSGGVVSTVIYK